MDVRLLGPLELVQDGVVAELKGPGERALLALLATDPGRVFSPGRLIDGLWGTSLPANPGNALHLRVSKLRRAVGPVLVRQPAGYLLDIEPEAVDATRFTRLVSERAFGEALRLWRGPPLAEFMEHEWARAEAARLEELHATAIEELTDIRLAAGEHVALVAELERLVAAAPLRERLRGQLMVALHRCGRTPEALEAFQSFKRQLTDELGIEPSSDLRRLEEAILREDPSVAAPHGDRSVATSLPAPLTSLVGRETDLERVAGLVAGSRLVTLTGPGGVGKTTLATAAAREVLPAHPDGVWFVPLATVTDGSAIAEAVAATLGIAGPEGTAPQRLVTSWLDRRQALLLLDNCEHLADPCARFVEQLLRSTGGGVHVLATSREALGVPGELQIPVPPLGLDDAAALFAERAAGVAPDDRVAADDEHVRRICERLDGIPLAIELAAARTKALQPEEIAARLDDRFRLLTAGPRTAEARHRTLRATVDWSHTLLSEDEQTLFRRTAVFRGGWTLAAAEATCGDSDGEGVLDVLSSLVDRSLVVVDSGRFRMLETIRAYAEERLEEAGERQELARRHAAYFADFVDRAEAHLRGPDQQAWLDALRTEESNLRHALDWSCAHPAVGSELALRLAGGLGWYWYVGRQVDGRAYISAALDAAEGAPPVARARALQALSLAVRPVGCIVHPTADGARLAEESLALFQQDDDAAGAALSQLLLAVEGVGASDPRPHLLMVGAARSALAASGDAWALAFADFAEMEIRLHQGQIDEALSLGDAALDAFDAIDDAWGRSAVLLHLGAGLRIAGRTEQAIETLQRAATLSRAGRLPNNVAGSLAQLGEARLQCGDHAEAEGCFVECEEIARELGNDTWLAQALLGRAGVARLRGEPAEAEQHYREALSLSMAGGYERGVVRARIGLAATLLDRDPSSDVTGALAAAKADADRLGDLDVRVAVREELARAAGLNGDTEARQRLLDEVGRLRSSGVASGATG